MKKKLALVMAGIMCITALTGCGKVSSEADSSEKAPAKKLFSKEISLAEAFSPESEYKIWYYADIDEGYGTGEIFEVYAFDGDEIKFYDLYYSDGLNIKDIASMTDEEVINLMEEKYVPKSYNEKNKEYLAELEQNLPKYRNAIDELLKIEAPSEEWTNNEGYPTVSELKQGIAPVLNSILDAIDNFDINKYETDNEIKYNYEIEIYTENNSTLTEELDDVVTSEHINALSNDYIYTESELIGMLEWLCEISDDYNRRMSNAEYETDREDARWHLFHDLYEGLYKEDCSKIEKSIKSDNTFVIVEPGNRTFNTVVDYPLSEGIKIGDTYFGGYHGPGSDLVCRCKEGTVFTMDKPDAPGTVKPEEYHASEETSTEE